MDWLAAALLAAATLAALALLWLLKRLTPPPPENVTQLYSHQHATRAGTILVPRDEIERCEQCGQWFNRATMCSPDAGETWYCENVPACLARSGLQR